MSVDYKLILNWPREAANVTTRSAVVVVVPPGPIASGAVFQGANLSKAQADALAKKKKINKNRTQNMVNKQNDIN